MIITLINKERFSRTVEVPDNTYDYYNIVCFDARNEPQRYRPDDLMFDAVGARYYKKTFRRVNWRSSIFEEV